MFKLSLDDFPVPAMLVDFRDVAQLAATCANDPELRREVLAPLLRQCLAIRANAAALALFEAREALELNDNGCFRAEFYDWTVAYLSAFLAGEETPWHETTVYTLGGVPRPVMVRAKPFSEDGAGFNHMLWSFIDVSGLKDAQAQAERAQRAAEAANRSKSDFLAVMSHEIRTPLNGVLGMAQLLMQRDLRAQDRDMVSVISQSGEALLAILNDMLDLAKIEAGKMDLEIVAFDIGELVNGARNAFTGIAQKKGLSFSVDIRPAAEGGYRGDPARLRQILYNLISNAVKFTDSGEVRVSVDREAGEGEGGMLVLSVADTGIGIPPDVLPKLFASFVQADSSTTRRYGGTGLGLSICRKLAEMMGGSIEVDSREGEGSTFRLRVALERQAQAPCAAAAPTGAERPAIALNAGDRGHALKILAAEDNAVNQLVLRTMLLAAGVEVTIVGDGRLALEAWAGGRFDLVLMDIQMPEMDGVTAVREIRRREAEGGLARTPVIALTANAMVHQVEQYRDAGMDGHVEKPIRIERLIAAIQDAVAQAPAKAA